MAINKASGSASIPTVSEEVLARQDRWEDRQLRRDALMYALQSPDWIIAPNGILNVAASYYNFLKGNNDNKSNAAN
jgi:hypothetical protein